MQWWSETSLRRREEERGGTTWSFLGVLVHHDGCDMTRKRRKAQAHHPEESPTISGSDTDANANGEDGLELRRMAQLEP
jgi:hypothetical protein